MNTMVIYEDSEILVIRKPAGIATETARFGQADVVSELKNYLHRTGQGTYLGMVHRLDQPVEGLLVFGKTQAATRFLTRCGLPRERRCLPRTRADDDERSRKITA